MNDIEFNTIFDNTIIQTHYVSADMLKQLNEAYNYASVSTANWLISKLKVIYSVITAGHTVKIESVPIIGLSSKQDFLVWVERDYNDVYSDIVLALS